MDKTITSVNFFGNFKLSFTIFRHFIYQLMYWYLMNVMGQLTWDVSGSLHRLLWVTLCGGLLTPAAAAVTGAQTPAASGVTPTTQIWVSGMRLWKKLSSNLNRPEKATRRRTIKATPTSGIYLEWQNFTNPLSHGLWWIAWFTAWGIWWVTCRS